LGKGREGKGREGKGREGKGTEFEYMQRPFSSQPPPEIYDSEPIS
jgi:hypothetical protein